MFIAELFIIAKTVKTTQISIRWRASEQNMVYSHNGVLLSHKKEWGSVICYNME